MIRARHECEECGCGAPEYISAAACSACGAWRAAYASALEEGALDAEAEARIYEGCSLRGRGGDHPEYRAAATALRRHADRLRSMARPERL